MAIHKQTLSALPSVRQLRALVAVYHAGSVSAAAEQLALTQPAVTVLLRELEARLGLQLFERRTRSLHRTEAAVEAVGYAQRALAELEAMASSMADRAAGSRGSVRIAATATVAQSVLPAAMRVFLDRHPAVKVHVEEVAPETFVDVLLSERTDLGVGTLEAPVPGLQEDVLLRDALVATALAQGPLPEGAAMNWKQLASCPIVTVKPGYGVRRRIDEAAAAAGVTLRIAHEVSLLATAVAMAAHGLGVALVPASAVPERSEPRLVTRRLTRPSVDRAIAIVSKGGRSLSPTAQAFAAVLKESAGRR